MSKFLVQSTHTNDECLQTLDELVAQGSGAIDRWNFGCAVNNHSNHVCYGVVEASNSAAALGSLPAVMRSKAQATEVGKFSADQVKSFHQ